MKTLVVLAFVLSGCSLTPGGFPVITLPASTPQGVVDGLNISVEALGGAADGMRRGAAWSTPEIQSHDFVPPSRVEAVVAPETDFVEAVRPSLRGPTPGVVLGADGVRERVDRVDRVGRAPRVSPRGPTPEPSPAPVTTAPALAPRPETVDIRTVPIERYAPVLRLPKDYVPLPTPAIDPPSRPVTPKGAPFYGDGTGSSEPARRAASPDRPDRDRTPRSTRSTPSVHAPRATSDAVQSKTWTDRETQSTPTWIEPGSVRGYRRAQ